MASWKKSAVAPPPPPVMIPPEEQTATLSIEKRKKGKQVTVIRGLPAEGNDLPALLTKLKTQCGTGGTLKDETLELQGNHLQNAKAELKKIGYRVKG